MNARTRGCVCAHCNAMQVAVCVDAHVPGCVSACVCVCACVYVCACVCVCVCTCVYNICECACQFMMVYYYGFEMSEPHVYESAC